MQSLQPSISSAASAAPQPSAPELGEYCGTVFSEDGSLYFICIAAESSQGELPGTFTTHHPGQAALDDWPSAAWVPREAHTIGTSGHTEFEKKLISVFGHEYTQGRFLYCDPLLPDDQDPSATAEEPSMEDKEHSSGDEGSPADVEDMMADQPDSLLEEDGDEGSSDNGYYPLTDDEDPDSDDDDTAEDACKPVGLWVGLKSVEVAPWDSVLRNGDFTSKVRSGLYEIWTLLPKDNLTTEKPKTPNSSGEPCADKQSKNDQQTDKPR